MDRYEERLVELHSVIAELSRQLELREGEKIVEEEEPEEEEEEEGEGERDPEQGKDNTDDQGGVDARAQSELASRTSTDIIDAQAVEARNAPKPEKLPVITLLSFIFRRESVWRITLAPAATARRTSPSCGCAGPRRPPRPAPTPPPVFRCSPSKRSWPTSRRGTFSSPPGKQGGRNATNAAISNLAIL